MKIVLAARAAAIATLVLLSGGAAAATDLMAAWSQAQATDPSLHAAEAALQAGREKAVQGRALLLPRVQLTAAATHVDDRASSSLPAALAPLVPEHGSGTVRQAALHLKQPLYDLKAGAEKRQLQEQGTLAQVRHLQARQDLMQRVSEAYFGVLLAEETLRVVGAEKAAVGLQRERAQARFEVGRGKVTDVQEAQARYDSVLAREVSAQSTLALRRAQFEALTGLKAQGLAPLRAAFAPGAPRADELDAWQQQGEQQASRVLTRRSELVIAGADVDKHKRSARPTLDLVAGYGARQQSGSLSALSGGETSRSATIGVQFSVPLFAGGALESRLREALAQQRKAEDELAAARRDTRLQVQDAFLALQTGAARVAALAQSLRSTRTALEATTLGRDLGTRTELDVLDAQQRFFNAELELAQARTDVLLSRVRLAAAAGVLGEADLQSLNAELAAA